MTDEVTETPVVEETTAELPTPEPTPTPKAKAKAKAVEPTPTPEPEPEPVAEESTQVQIYVSNQGLATIQRTVEGRTEYYMPVHVLTETYEKQVEVPCNRPVMVDKDIAAVLQPIIERQRNGGK